MPHPEVREKAFMLLEERIKLAEEATGIGTWDFDPIEKKAVYDDQCKKLFGFTGSHEFTYSHFLACIDPSDRAERERELYKTLTGEKKDGRYEAQYRIKTIDNGTTRWISSKGKVFFDEKGQAIRLIGTLLDISREKISEQQRQEQLEQIVAERTALLQEVNKKLEASNQNLSEFAYAASHDLQEPLRKINTFCAQLKDKNYGDQEEEINKYLNKISGASKRMSRLIEDLLNYARLQNTEETKIPTDLKKIVQDVLHEFDLEITTTDATIVVGDLPVIQAIPLRMTQLFHNLMSNSLKFTPPGRQPRISIQSRRLSETDKSRQQSLNQTLEYNEIIFRDNGIGFNPEFSEKIFNIFQRLNGRSEYEGTGIGLTLCRKIVVNHHGLIFARSKEGEGSEFTIIFPAITR